MKEIIDIKPKIVEDVDGNFTVFASNIKYGAIVSDKNSLRAMEKFKEGMNLCMAVKTLMDFKIENGNKNIFYVANFI